MTRRGDHEGDATRAAQHARTLADTTEIFVKACARAGVACAFHPKEHLFVLETPAGRRVRFHTASQAFTWLDGYVAGREAAYVKPPHAKED